MLAQLECGVTFKRCWKMGFKIWRWVFLTIWRLLFNVHNTTHVWNLEILSLFLFIMQPAPSKCPTEAQEYDDLIYSSHNCNSISGNFYLTSIRLLMSTMSCHMQMRLLRQCNARPCNTIEFILYTGPYKIQANSYLFDPLMGYQSM